MKKLSKLAMATLTGIVFGVPWMPVFAEAPALEPITITATRVEKNGR